jgi:hypothetical protein
LIDGPLECGQRGPAFGQAAEIERLIGDGVAPGAAIGALAEVLVDARRRDGLTLTSSRADSASRATSQFTLL